MVNQLQTLRKLQAVDAELFSLRNEARQKPLALERTRQFLAEEEAKAQAIEARLKATQVGQKEKEIELATREASVKKLQAQLFQLRTNKEYTAMQQEIDRAKADASLLEEEIIALLDVIDRTKQQHSEQSALVEGRQEALRTEQTRVTRELDAIRERIAQLEKERGLYTPLVDPESLSIYERVLVNRDGLAMVPLVSDSCGGCHMVQPPQVISEAHLKARLVTCDSCNRILYVDEIAG